MSKRIVIALGGNALGNNPKEQLLAVKSTASPIVDLIEEGYEVIICHGNGPQVGMINLAIEEASKSNVIIPEIPFPECNAMSQGYIGYHLQNALREELIKRDINKPVATVITQVIVDKNDTAFQNPTKPIGAFYTKEEAEILEKEKSYVVVEDAGRGYRRVVPSPLPIGIVEEDIIKTLTKAGHIAIAVGGGGIPVIEEVHSLIGVSAVVDKDFASEKLAEVVEADYLIILTAVEKVALNYGKENEKLLDTLSINEVKQYIKEGHFARGSMLPKVEAAIKFAESKEGRKALITSLEKAKEGIEGKTGTLIV
ncbi:carbamate kinase [Alkaliphilus sp. B6464]|uniref:carbamate kinase n=1 Tax=Alkaliphilus sp. B6464 TaxID=2731219 RepID=UPI001BAAF6CD|nr:carbamate kinase [Alkaliphilus sp. B6464]QUH20049.1 carbamate kinase [Alkaliphilus sp. B6464]